MSGKFRIQIPIYFYFLPIFSCVANSQSLGQQQQALDAITNTADRICTVVNAEGSSKSAKVTGEVNAQLDGLLKKLVESSIGFKGQYNAETYKGVFQEDLPTILKSTQDCKKGVLDKLVDPLLPNPASSSTSGSLATTRPAFHLSDNTETNFNGTAIINNP